MRLTSLSVATPAYNEHECIEPVLTGWFDYLSGRFPVGSYEVVVCDDGSIDGTAEIHNTVAAGVTRFLVGEALVRSADPAALLRAMLAAGGAP